jgi:hypothetical protein
MNTRQCLKIAIRINKLLLVELGHGIDPARTVAEPRYARDVLLVCEALRDGELPRLARRFRQAASEEAPAVAAVPQRSGFRASRFLGSLFGGLQAEDSRPAPLPSISLAAAAQALRQPETRP